MKNQKTMYLLAKARAIAEGPKAYRMMRGYALTETEVRRIYGREGFTNPKTYDRHIGIWQEMGWVHISPVGENKENVYFFSLDDADSTERSLHMELRRRFSDCAEGDLPGVLCS